MQRSRATAALMRLKEIDRKYKSKIQDENQLESSVSTISTLNSISNEVKKSIPGSGDSSDTGLKPKLKIKMPDAHIEQVKEVPFEGKKDFSAIAVTIFNKTSEESLETNSPVISEEVSHNTTNVDSIGPAGEGNVTDSFELIKNNNKVSSDERLVTEVSEDQSQLISKLSSSKNDQIIEDFGIQIVESLSSSQNLPYTSSSSGKEVRPNTYSNDSFDEESNSFPTYENSNDNKSSGTSSIKSDMQKKSSRNTKDETKIIELMSPKLIHTTSVCEVDLNKELSQYVKITENTESTESIKPVCLLKSPKVCMIQKPKQKRSGRAKSSMNSHKSETTTVQIIPKHQTHINNILSEKTNTKQEPGSHWSSPKTQSSKGSKITSNSKKSGIQKRGELDIAIVLKKKEQQTRSKTSLSGNETIVQKDEKSLSSIYHLRQEDIDHHTVQEFNQNLKCNQKFPRSPKTGIIHTKEQKQNSHESDNFDKIVSSHNHGTPYAIYKTVSTKPVPLTRIRGILDSQNMKVHRNQTLRHNAQQRHSDKMVKNRNNAKNTKSAKSYRNSKSLENETLVPRRKQDVNPLETQMTALRMKNKQNNIQLKVSRYIQQFEEERRKLMMYPLDPPFIHKTESLAFKPLDFPKIIEFTRPDIAEMYSSLKLPSAVDYRNALRIRVMEIREWLKDQFTLYRDYSSLISTINSNYIPTTLEDAKKIIQEVQQSSNSRRNRHRK
ncbi:uncharacterized protein LOC107273839 isoform X2 [Cephus cinctus]|uniref:Uncharacterized protein LOC107273839 isoform X2 n=1 Tax=Cephus cinctus TaxID=211228 RepID=A0AAJ7RTL2_CEPCN|nr:uncharacterized protein LOC107273839 isoform X2 [Cephus cinctus]